MPEKMRIFWSSELEAKFNTAYEAAMQQWPVPYDDIFVSTSYGNTHVVSSGPVNAKSVVSLNPGGGSVTIWNRNVEPLSQRYRTYAVDVIGWLNKSVPTRPIRNHLEFRQWMTELLDGLRINKTHIIGNSNGGFFTLETALHLPERVDRVVLISPAATFVQMWNWWLRLLISAHMIAPLLRSESMVQHDYAWLWQGFPRNPVDANLKSITMVAGYPRYRPSINSFTPHVFSDAELRQIKAHVLLLIGVEEKQLTKAFGNEYLDYLTRVHRLVPFKRP